MVLACNSSAGPPQSTPTAEVVLVPSDPDLQWTLSRATDGKSLALTYTATNNTDQPIYVCDQMIQHTANGYQRTKQAVILQISDREAAVAKGQLSPDAPVALLTPPSFV